MIHSSISLVTEFTLDQLATGVAARVHHFERYCQSSHKIAVNSTKRYDTGVVARLRAAQDFDIEQLRGSTVVVIALGSPIMVRLARRLGKAGIDCVLDVSDSLQIQASDRIRAGSLKEKFVGVWQLFEVAVSSQNVGLSYISRQDVIADAKLVRRYREVLVVPYAAPDSLSKLGAPTWPAERIVLSGDFDSYHNLAGLDALLNAAASVERCIRIDLYGPNAPKRSLPTNVKYKGWATRLEDIYEGNSVVFVSNQKSSGFPNKLGEAIAAGRWVVVDASLATDVADYQSVSSFSNVDDLRDILCRLSRGERMA